MVKTHQFALIEAPIRKTIRKHGANRKRVLGALAMVFCLSPSHDAHANFLEALFGATRPQVESQTPPSSPLQVTVRKKSSKKKPKVAVVKPASDKPVELQKPTLTAADPHWYLKDETLRRGDIVVLSNRVLVFRGDASSIRQASFEDVKRTKSLSGKERGRIRSMTETWTGTLPNYKVIQDPSSPVVTGPSERSDSQKRTLVNVILP